MPLSKMTAAILDDLDYTVDPSAVSAAWKQFDGLAVISLLLLLWPRRPFP